MHHLELASSIFDHLNEIIYVSDPDNNLLYINKAGEQLTGRPAGRRSFVQKVLPGVSFFFR